MIDRKTLEGVLDFWKNGGCPGSIMEKQREFNRIAYSESVKRIEKWISELDSGKEM